MKHLLVFICALAAVQAAKLDGFSSRGHNDDSTGVPLPILSDVDLRSSSSQLHSSQANQGFSGNSNSVLQSPNSFSEQSPASQNQRFSEGPSQSYSQPSNQLGSGLSGLNSQIVAATPSRSYSIPARGSQSSAGSFGQTSSGFSSPSGIAGPANQAFSQNQVVQSGQEFSDPSLHSHSVSASAGQTFTGVSDSSFQNQPAQSSQRYSQPSRHSSSASTGQSFNQLSSSSSFQAQPSQFGQVSQNYNTPSQSVAGSFGQSFDSAATGQSYSGSANGQSFSGPANSQSFSGSANGQSFSGSANGQSFSGPANSQSFSGPANSQSFSGPANGQSFSGPAKSQSFSGPANGQSFSGSSGQSFGGAAEHSVSRSTTGQNFGVSGGASFSAQASQPTRPTQAYSEPSVQLGSGSGIQSHRQSSGSSFQTQSAQSAQTYSGPSQSFSASSGTSLPAQSVQSAQPSQTYSGPSNQVASLSAQPVQATQPSQSYSGSANQINSGFNAQHSSQAINPEFVRQGHSLSGFTGVAAGAASHQTGSGLNEGSLSGASSRGPQGSSNYDAPAANTCGEGEILHFDGSCVVPEISRHVFVYAAPEQEGRSYGPPPEIPLPKEEHNIVFIRTPEGGDAQDPIVIPPPQKKHIIYVLSKDSGNQEQKVIEITTPKPKSPEVYFVNYAEGENPTLPGGIDFEAALNSAVHADGQVIGAGTPSGPSGSLTGTLQGSHSLGNQQGATFGRGGDFVSGNDAPGSFSPNAGAEFAGNVNNNFVDHSPVSAGGFSSNIGGGSSFGGLEVVVDDSHESFDDNAVFFGGNANRPNLQITPASGVPLPSALYGSA